MILFCVLGLDVVLGGASCFGLCFGLLYWFWEVLCVLVFRRVELLGGLRNGLKVLGGGYRM